MSTFTLEEPLPSCFVDEELLEQLEDYLISRFPAKHPTLIRGDKISYIASITDGLGTENLASIKTLTPPRIPETTNIIGFDLNHDEMPLRMHIQMKFDRRAYLSLLSIRASGQNARDFVIATREDIWRILAAKQTLNWILNPAGFWGPAVQVLAFVITMMTLMFGVGLIQESPTRVGISIIVGISGAWYLISGYLFRPYTMFGTNGQARKNAMWKWLSLGVLTFVLYGIVATYLRQSFFGF